jgi:hypothetical protein
MQMSVTMPYAKLVSPPRIPPRGTRRRTRQEDARKETAHKIVIYGEKPDGPMYQQGVGIPKR